MTAAHAIGESIGRRLGLIPHDRWVVALERAEPEIVRRRGQSLAELAPLVETDADVFLELAGLLSIGETYFLRHGGHFDVITGRVERALSAAGPAGRVRIWSAGCSSGEEPYSIAIAVHARLGAAALDRIEVVATDIDVRAIRKAQAARYTPWSFRGAPPWLLPGYFTQGPANQVTLSHPGVLRAVRFEAMPLATRAASFAPDSLDIVVFRNVAIYLLDHARVGLQRAMSRALCEGGLLVQGPSDPPPPADAFRAVVGDETLCCYTARRGLGVDGEAAEDADARGALAASTADTLRPASSALQEPTRPARASRTQTSRHASTRPRRRTNDLVPRGESTATPSAAVGLSRETTFDEASLERALSMAESGDVDQALAMVAAAGSIPDAMRWRFRGQVMLAARRLPDAIEQFRGAVFLDPHAPTTRFWYAMALHAARHDEAAMAQLRELERQLTALGPESPVDDGEATASTLLDSVRLLMEGYE